MTREICEWIKTTYYEKDPDYTFYDPGCLTVSYKWNFNEIKENFKYCPYCGREIEVIEYDK
jgi:hypothetical protein